MEVKFSVLIVKSPVMAVQFVGVALCNLCKEKTGLKELSCS
jgi:hypothetical protein